MYDTRVLPSEAPSATIPATQRRRVLLCLADERPHLVTQAIYGLAHQPEPWLPDEVVVATTERGAQEAQARLVRQPRLQTLFSKLVPTIERVPEFTVEVVRQIQSPESPVASIALARHRRDFSNCILRTVQRVTDDANSELIVALGNEGPALNSFVAGHTLSLLGRPQDRLMQVVVGDGDGKDDFFFPADPAPTSDPRISVLEIPFARIDRVAPMRDMVRQADYATLCHGLDGHAHLQISNEFHGLNFRFSNAFDIPCDSSHRVTGPRFEPRAAALYALYAERARREAPFLGDEQLLDEPDAYLQAYDACLVGGEVKSGLTDRPRTLTRAALSAARSRIGRTLTALIRGGPSYGDYRIYRHKDNGGYGLQLRPEQVAIVNGWNGFGVA